MERRERLKTRWAQLEAVVGTEKRLSIVAQDIVDHFEQRLEAMDGKAMVVCMSRRICVDLYRELVRLRPGWHDEDDARGAIKVVMTGSASDPPEWQQHIRSKAWREALAHKFRDPADPMKIVLVRDMWLTGFDAPSLHTMYVDKPMRGHGLMQAIARVNRVFKDKPGGLVVDYLGLAHELRRALATYTESGGRGQTALDQEAAGCGDAGEIRRVLRPVPRLRLVSLDDGKFSGANGADSRCPGAHPGAGERKGTLHERRSGAIAGLCTGCATRGGAAHPRRCGILPAGAFGVVQEGRRGDPPRRRPGLGHTADHLAGRRARRGDGHLRGGWPGQAGHLSAVGRVSGRSARDASPQLGRGTAPEAAQRRGFQQASNKNVVQARSFAEMLEQTLRRYQNRAIETAQVIEELIQLVKDIREAGARGERLGLSEDELAFYDALETNDSAVQVMGDEVLRDIARELVETVRKNVTIDWTMRENVRAQLRVLVRRILRRHGYPPDKQEKATQMVLEQAEVLSEGWVV